MDSTRKHHDYISPATAICIQIDIQFTLKCITYGYLGTVLRNESLLSIQHSHVVPQSTMDSTRKHNGLHFTRNCHNYSNRPSFDPWCITYGYLGHLWCNKPIVNTAFTCCPIIDHDATYKCHDYICHRNCHIYPTDLQFTQKCITYGSLSIWLHNQTLHNTAFTCCPIIHHGFHMQV